MTSSITTLLPGLALLATLAVAPGAAAEPPVTDGLLKLGEQAYQRECAACHGATGAGDGPGAYILNPKPRNFQLGVYKLRSTPNGEPPTPQDLFRTITRGISVSSMPSFASLSEEVRWGLVHHVLRLGGLEDETPTPVTVPAEPEKTAASVDNGRRVYRRLECASCHGSDGWGGGPSSTTLENDAKERVFPLNLTTGTYKGGSSPRDLYLRIATGMDGSPMPSYAAEATPDEIWDLVHYLQTLAE